MIWRGTADRAALVTNALSAAVTLALLAAIMFNPPVPAPLAEAPKPTETQLSLVEEPPPPPAAPQPQPAPEPPEPVVASPLPSPLPPPRRPPHILHRQQKPPPRPEPMQNVAPREAPPAESQGRVAQQAPENHSAEAAYVSRLHAMVARNTVPPHGAAYRLHHPTGEVVVGFTLARNGTLSNVHVLRSSGSDILDAQGCNIVAGLRYPVMPDDVFPGAPAHAFSVPVAFTEAASDDQL